MTVRREARERAGVSQVRVAAESNTSLGTVRAYELDPEGVTPRKRALLDPIYERFAAEPESKVA